MTSKRIGTDAPATLQDIADALRRGAVTSRELVEAVLSRIADEAGEGMRTFIRLFPEQARAVADTVDFLRAAGVPLPLLAGIPVSVKDLCDIAGSTTTAGSTVLKNQPPAAGDAGAVARLRAAGAVIIGATNMTEFALGGLGLNPHYGTPCNPYDRATGRIPGGSSSGAAVSVTDGMATVALGTDTAGSVRMPAALCGIAGFKPTARRVPLDGLVPLAPSMDSVGGLGLTTVCCALFDAALAGEPLQPPDPVALSGLRLAVPQTLVLDDIDPAVAAAFERALSHLSASGAVVTDVPFAELAELPHLNRSGGFSIMEGFEWHRRWLPDRLDEYDSVIGKRFMSGANATAADYIELVNGRRSLIERMQPELALFDAILMPTVPITAPPIAEFEADEEKWIACNRLLIRNPTVANFLDGCALTVPCHAAGDAPVGLTVMGGSFCDRRILAIGTAVEGAVSPYSFGQGTVRAKLVEAGVGAT